MMKIPEILNCEACFDGVPVRGVMLQASFGMTRKNSYTFIFGPTDSKGNTFLNRSKVMSDAKSQFDIAMMDFDPLEKGFNGTISVTVMSEQDIQLAINAYQLFNTVIGYPENYYDDLERASICPYTKNADIITIKVNGAEQFSEPEHE